MSESTEEKLERGARIVTRDWMRLTGRDRLLIVTNGKYVRERQALEREARKIAGSVETRIVEDTGRHVGIAFDRREDVFDPYTAVIAATEYSLVTTRAAARAVRLKKKFLSLPLSTNDGRSLLEYDFLTMETRRSRLMAGIIMDYLQQADTLQVTTEAGTSLSLGKRSREPGFFNGTVRDGRGYASASMEAYVAVEENRTSGTLVVDGSLGYIGRPEMPVQVIFSEGRIAAIEENAAGRRLRAFLEAYRDTEVARAGEFGIGLNSRAACQGNCYIEDESSYGTFHIGQGRNLALGGLLQANGHFDLVGLSPDIYADNRKIMEKGRIIIPEPVLY